MATLPRSATKYPPGPLLHRPVSEFDAGINTSTAWTEHLEGALTPAVPGLHPASGTRKSLSESNAPNSYSDAEDDAHDDPEELAVPARALYKFEGKAEFRELSVDAGDELEVVKADVGEGWSLVRDVSGEVGLLPQTYYTLTSEFALAPDLQLDIPAVGLKRETSSSSLTPRPSPRVSKTGIESDLYSLIPQTTGEWFSPLPSFRQSLLGGKTFNRFSSFVTTGAESFVLNGTATAPSSHLGLTISNQSGHSKEESTASILEAREEERNRLGLGEADKHYIDTSPHGPTWKSKTPSFRILVHSPVKRSEGLGGTNAYTLYSVTSLFPVLPDPSTVPNGSEWVDVVDPDEPPPDPLSPTEAEIGTRVTVHRRFSHFVMLHTALHKRLPGIALPPLPEKQYAGRFSDDFVEARRGDLERYLHKIVRHPVVRYAEVLVFFLGCENDNEFTKGIPKFVSAPAAGPNFYARIYHPAFNVDLEEADNSINSFQNHARAVGKGIQGLRSVFGRAREARVEMSKAERLLSYSLLSLITSTPLASAPTTGTQEEDENYNTKAKGLANSDGAWCWREGCEECLRLTKGVQKTCDTLQTVANLYDGHARRAQMATHESLKLMAHPSSHYETVITTHKSTLTRYRESTALGKGASYADEDMASRCETVLNTTMAELDTYHTQKVQEVQTILCDHLDGEIALYEQILTRLKGARQALTKDGLDKFSLSPRQPSIYERDLGTGNNAGGGIGATRPLPMPCPHVYDAAPMRPVSVAIQEGVGMFLGQGRGAGDEGRGSVFSRFW